MLDWITIKNQKDVGFYTFLGTFVSIALSLAFTISTLYFAEPGALQLPTTYLVAILVPLLVAPTVTSFCLRLVLKLEQTKKKLEVISQTDALTRVYNRGFFWEHTEKELEDARKTHLPVAVIILDVDNFKNFNDTYGHLLGDRILQQCAQTASRCLRKGDYIARYGGEEFAVFLKDCPELSAKNVAERMRQSIADIKLIHEEETLQITVSLGLVWSSGSYSLETLARVADQAMYSAKHQGRNQLVSLEV